MALNLVPDSGAFPPGGPTGLQAVIKARAYKEYDDDADIVAFFYAYNVLAQIYADWFNSINLPIYTGLSGALLDWVARGLYGRIRPTLYSDQPYSQGLIASDEIGLLEVAEFDIIDNITNVAVTSDDIFKRIITWHFYKGDGKQVSVPWLRRRVLRFLYGVNGEDYNQPGQNVSIVFGGSNLTITIVSGIVTTLGQDLIASNEIGQMEIGGEVVTLVTPVAVPSVAPIFCEAINTGALEMPAQFTATAQIGVIGV